MEPPPGRSGRDQAEQYLREHRMAEIVQVGPIAPHEQPHRSPCPPLAARRAAAPSPPRPAPCTQPHAAPCDPITIPPRVRAARACQGVLAELLFHKPDDPRAFIVAALERVKAAGARPLLDGRDLSAMFDMFDVTRSGTVTAAQANAALATALGGARAAEATEAAAAAGGRGAKAAGGGRGSCGGRFPLVPGDAAAAGARLLSKPEFVSCMGRVLIQAAPGCQLSALPGEEDEGAAAAAAGGRSSGSGSDDP
jgi:hypothetical protein